MKIEVLDTKKHANLQYHKDEYPQNPFVPVLANELGVLANNLVVVFTNEENPKLVALLGRTKNVVINKDYKGFMPSALLNYPFFLAPIQDKNVICIDIEAKQLKGKGEPLFDKDGKATKFTEQLTNVMSNYNDIDIRTRIAVSEIKKTGILESKELGININGKEQTIIKGFSIVNVEKLNNLDDKTLADFARRGYLELIYSHLRSLGNLQILADSIIANDKNEKTTKTDKK